MIKGFKNFKWGYVIIFLILACVGALCIAFPQTLKIVCIVSGAILALYSAILFILTLAKRERGGKFALKAIISAIALAAGLVTAILNQQSVGVLTSLLGLYMVIDGSFKLQTTVNSKRFQVAAWWIMLSLAVIIIAGGFISLKWTPTEDNALWTSRILGVTLIVDGIANLLTIPFASAYEKNMVEAIKEDLGVGEQPSEQPKNECPTGDGSEPLVISIDGENISLDTEEK